MSERDNILRPKLGKAPEPKPVPGDFKLELTRVFYQMVFFSYQAIIWVVASFMWMFAYFLYVILGRKDFWLPIGICLLLAVISLGIQRLLDGLWNEEKERQIKEFQKK